MESFSLDLRHCVAPTNHIWTFSGCGTVSPLPGTVCGVRGFFSPPVAAPDCQISFSFEVNGSPVPDCGSRGKEDVGLLLSGAEWRIDRIVRRGTYHWRKGVGVVSFAVESELTAASSGHGFAVLVRATNRGPEPLALRLVANFSPGGLRNVPLGPEWNFVPPAPSSETAVRTGACSWRGGGGAECRLSGDGGVMRELPPRASAQWGVGVVFDVPGEPAAAISARDPAPAETADSTHDAWRRRMEAASAALPTLSSDIPGLEAYWKRSIASGLVSLWENPNFAVSPFPAASGVDGGSICCYPWDAAGYAARFLVMLFGERTFDFVRALIASGIDRHICMAPDGSGQGDCSYSYSLWSVLNLYWHTVAATGAGLDLFDEVLNVFMADERRLPDFGDLKDYGSQRNLLEMRSTGYEHVVPSPNAERAWAYDRLADISEVIGRPGASAWRDKATAIRAAIRSQLWDDRAGWFRCLNPTVGSSETVFSIQCFDALRFGACTPPMRAAMLRLVRDGAFLGRFGVSSVSAEDGAHYELNDPDWSGGGAYTGEGPQLAETLWRCGESELALDVLSRHFWMGEALPYFPQEHYCDRPAVPAHKRANSISGAAGFEAILFGMCGLEPRLDGSLGVSPHPPQRGTVEIRGIRHRGRSCDIVLSNGQVRSSG